MGGIIYLLQMRSQGKVDGVLRNLSQSGSFIAVLTSYTISYASFYR